MADQAEATGRLDAVLLSQLMLEAAREHLQARALSDETAADVSRSAVSDAVSIAA